MPAPVSRYYLCLYVCSGEEARRDIDVPVCRDEICTGDSAYIHNDEGTTGMDSSRLQ